MDELLPLLPTLVHLARTGSMSQTAKQMGVPRSTVSRRLLRLEGLMGMKVAERNTQRFRLTGAGRRLVQGAVGALAQLETVREQVVASAGEVRGKLRVATPAGMSGAFIGGFLAFLDERHPGIDVELVVTERPPTRLEEGFDLILFMGAPEPSVWLRRRLSGADLVAVASPVYLSRRGTPRTLEALGAHALLSSHGHQGANTWPRLKGPPISVQPKLLTNDLSTLRAAALAGIGIAMIPLHVVGEDLASNELHRVLPSVLGQSIDIFALYLPERRASPVLKAVLSLIEEFAGAQAPLNAGQR